MDLRETQEQTDTPEGLKEDDLMEMSAPTLRKKAEDPEEEVPENKLTSVNLGEGF